MAQQQLLNLSTTFHENTFSTSQTVTSTQKDHDINNSSTHMQTHLKHSLQSQLDHASDYEPLQNKTGLPWTTNYIQ